MTPGGAPEPPLGRGVLFGLLAATAGALLSAVPAAALGVIGLSAPRSEDAALGWVAGLLMVAFVGVLVGAVALGCAVAARIGGIRAGLICTGIIVVVPIVAGAPVMARGITAVIAAGVAVPVLAAAGLLGAVWGGRGRMRFPLLLPPDAPRPPAAPAATDVTKWPATSRGVQPEQMGAVGGGEVPTRAERNVRTVASWLDRLTDPGDRRS